MGDFEKAGYYLNTNFRAEVNEDSGDENSKIELYDLLQYQALVNINLGEKTKGQTDLQNLVYTIDANLATNRPEKYLLLAGCYAAIGQHDKSIEQLSIVVEMGYNDYYAMVTNSLLDSLHGNDKYQNIISIVKSRNDKMREKVLQEGYLTK